MGVPDRPTAAATARDASGGLATAVRYVLVGGCLFLVDLCVFQALVRGLGAPVWLAQAGSRTVGAGVGFFAHRSLTFRSQGGSVAAQGTGYVAVMVWNLLTSPWLVEGLVWATAGRLLVAKVLAEAILVVQTFLLLRFVFRGRPE